MINYDALDTAMNRSALRSMKSHVGSKVKAQVYINSGIDGTKVVEGICIDVYADTSFFDAVTYKIKEDDTGIVYCSPAFYYREWKE